MMSKVEDSQQGETLIHVRSRWQYMKQRLKRRGVVEVGPTHPRQDMLGAMQTAIRKLFDDYPEAHIPVAEDLDSTAVDDCIKFNVESPSGKVYKFESYASSVFACIRAATDINQDEFIHSLAPVELPYLEFISNSRSGQDFYFTNNQRFVIKTDHEHCIQFFLSILRDYLGHFQTYPHSLLVKFHGLYSITTSTTKKRYFLVMQSIFYPTIRLEERFDIKGCIANRYQDPNPPGRKTILVLKDQNFLEETIDIGGQKEWFLTQLRADVDFLKSLGVLDYSLLLGRHPLKMQEKQESVGNLVLRLKKSFGTDGSQQPILSEDTEDKDHVQPPVEHYTGSHGDGNSQTEVAMNGIEMNVMTNENSLPTKSTNQNNSSPPSAPNQSPPKKSSKGGRKKSSHKKFGFLRSLSDRRYLDSTGYTFKNRRLLQNCANTLHVVDGPKFRYYIGVIDFFTEFRCRQRVGKWLKDMKTCCGSHSTEPPRIYAERFYEFISERIK